MSQRLRSRLAEPLAVGLGALLMLATYAWLVRYGLDLIDEGYFLDLATRVLHGQLPYRDFDTYYTPGLLYLDGLVLRLFGPDVMPARLLIVGLRVACALLVYRLARRVAPAPFAALPALVIAVMGVVVGAHPGWPALVATLLMLEALACHAASPRSTWWLGLAGLAAGAAFLFKQNVGAFALLASAGYVVLRGRPESGLLLMALRLGYAVWLALTVRVFLTSALDERIGPALWLPLVGTLGLLVCWSMSPPRRLVWRGVQPVIVEGTWVGGGFALLTLLWLVPLIAALGIDNTPFSLFLGRVNQGALTFPLDQLPRGAVPVGLVALWLPLGLALFGRPRPARLVLPLGIAAAGSLFLRSLPTRVVPADAVTRTDEFPRLSMLDLELGSLFLYLGVAAAWLALLLLARQLVRREPLPLVGWYLLAGALAELALYPRADIAHAMLAGAPLLVVGAWALARVHATLTAAAGSVALNAGVFAGLLVVPVAAVLPHAYGAYVDLARPGDAVGYVPLGLARASILAPPTDGEPLRQAITFLEDHTTPGEPVFAYPVDPLVNFLTDRPNPTRFDHLMPGALTPADMDQVVADLDAARPRYILWDHAGVVFWNTDHPNRRLSDYIWQCYREIAAFHLYLVLERGGC